MNYLQLKINKCRISVVQENYTDSSILGYTGDDDKFIGMSEFTIPSEHLIKMKDFYAEHIFKKEFLDNIVDEESNIDMDHTSTNADMLIYWMYFITHTFKEYVLRLDCENLFWVAHDLMHVKHDFYGQTFHCSAYDELVRHRQAYKILQRRKIKVSDEFLEPIIDEYNKRKWGCNNTFQEPRSIVKLSTIKTFTHINHW